MNITSVQVAYDFFYQPVPEQGQGSGFVIDKQGHILTNNHVVEGAQLVEVTLSDKKKYKATVLGKDKAHDIALLQISNAPDLQPATLADSTHLMVGQRVYAIGNPFGFQGTMTRGIISALRSVQLPTGMKIDNAIQTDASVNPGNSGGPLLNSHGEVIGITTMIASNPNGGAEQSAGIGFAIPISTAKAVLDDFARYGRVRRPSMDAVTLEISPDLAQQIGLPADYGVLIERVLPNGAAERAGLHGGSQRAYLGFTPNRAWWRSDRCNRRARGYEQAGSLERTERASRRRHHHRYRLPRKAAHEHEGHTFRRNAAADEGRIDLAFIHHQHKKNGPDRSGPFSCLRFAD